MRRQGFTGVRHLPCAGIILLAGTLFASAGPPPPPAPETSASIPPVYLIGIGDVLGVHVWRDPDLSRTGVMVRPDGRISLPLVGDVQAAGITGSTLSSMVSGMLKEYVNDPHVTVIIEAINSYRVYVLGHVLKSGVYAFQTPTRLVEALATAGGFDQFADTSHLVVLSSRTAGAQAHIEVDFKKIVSGARLQDNIYLRPGDTIIVP